MQPWRVGHQPTPPPALVPAAAGQSRGRTHRRPRPRIPATARSSESWPGSEVWIRRCAASRVRCGSASNSAKSSRHASGWLDSSGLVSAASRSGRAPCVEWAWVWARRRLLEAPPRSHRERLHGFGEPHNLSRERFARRIRDTALFDLQRVRRSIGRFSRQIDHAGTGRERVRRRQWRPLAGTCCAASPRRCGASRRTSRRPRSR